MGKLTREKESSLLHNYIIIKRKRPEPLHLVWHGFPLQKQTMHELNSLASIAAMK